jgi:regulator of nucleoside diphosphate kinase
MTMIKQHELFVSEHDAEALAAMLGAHRSAHPLEADASDALAELLMQAQLVPAGRLPHDRVTMNCGVTYVEEPAGVRRTVTLVHPVEADPARGSISVLSPIGLALIGRRRGDVVHALLPGDRRRAIRIVETLRHRQPLRPAA